MNTQPKVSNSLKGLLKETKWRLNTAKAGKQELEDGNFHSSEAKEAKRDIVSYGGFVEALEVIEKRIEEMLKAEGNLKVKKNHTGIFQFAIYLNGAGKNHKEAWESVQDNLMSKDMANMPPKSDIKLVDQEPEPE